MPRATLSAFYGVLVIVCQLSSLSATSASTRERYFNSVDIKREIGAEDWKFFINSATEWQEKLWAYHVQQGKRLENWSWTWRLAWVRVCARQIGPTCNGIIADAFTDRALVVRAQAASALGRRWENSHDERAVALLAGGFRNRGNMRAGKPLFIQEKILFAIHQIGGDVANNTGRALAASHPQTRDYWSRLSRDIRQ